MTIAEQTAISLNMQCNSLATGPALFSTVIFSNLKSFASTSKVYV